jgi:hypothetical protein
MTQKERFDKLLLNIVGLKYGRLQVLAILNEYSPSKKRLAKCQCDCGKEVSIIIENLKNGHTQSCGCLRKELMHENIKNATRAQIASGRIKDPKIGSAIRVFNNRYNDGDLKFDDFYLLSQQNCFYCGVEPSNIFNNYKNGKSYSDERIINGDFIYNGLDRINSSIEHNKSNVVPCCKICNTMKMDTPSDVFFEKIKSIYNKHLL